MDNRKPWMRFGGAAGPVADGLIAGGVLAGTLTAAAAEESAVPESSTSRAAGEELLIGDVREQVEAAVLVDEDFAVPGTETGGRA